MMKKLLEGFAVQNEHANLLHDYGFFDLLEGFLVVNAIPAINSYK